MQSDKKPSLLRRTTSTFSRASKVVTKKLTGQNLGEKRRSKVIQNEVHNVDAFLESNKPMVSHAQNTFYADWTPQDLPFTQAEIESKLRRSFPIAPYAQPSFDDIEVPWWIRELPLNVFDTLSIRPIDATRGQRMLDRAVRACLEHCFHDPIQRGVPPAWSVVLAYRWLSSRPENTTAALEGIEIRQLPSWNSGRYAGYAVLTHEPRVKLQLPPCKPLVEIQKNASFERARSHDLRHFANFGAIIVGEVLQSMCFYAVQAHLTPKMSWFCKSRSQISHSAEASQLSDSRVSEASMLIGRRTSFTYSVTDPSIFLQGLLSSLTVK